ncbi:MAG TPA: hypothetical protein VJ373_01975 [Desulfatiglandales bacterium]|nr:hypothetical protein [Desulfatiglandales bacterium]
MIEKQQMIEGLFDSIGFKERIVIGMYDGDRVYFDIDFSDELADGLMTLAFMDDKVREGIKELIINLEAILEGVENYKPGKGEDLH